MSRLFTRRTATRLEEPDHDPASAYSSLLDADRVSVLTDRHSRDFAEHHHTYSPSSPPSNVHDFGRQPSASPQPHTQSQVSRSRTLKAQAQAQAHQRAKSYTLGGVVNGHGPSNWLGGAEARRSSWTGERREIRKLQKDPNGSARPGCSLEISDSDGTDGSGGEKEKGSVRRKMERLRGLYRKGEK